MEKNQQLKPPIGILGGTFDPIHYGHLRIAFELMQTLPLNRIHFIPCQIPVLKPNAHASAKHRLAMLNLAIDNEPAFICDDREITRETPSYMLDTLISLHQEYPNTPLCLILGIDVFNQLSKWYKWHNLIHTCHFIILPRPAYSLKFDHNLALQQLFEQHHIDDKQLLTQNTSGSILMHKVSQLEISSTAIRQLIQHGLSPRYLLPQAVLEYIHQHKLYTC